jgi:uncharacterized DUF497 family protein
MEFEWSLYRSTKLTQEEIAESFEDPFSLRFLPDANRFSALNRFFSLGCSSSGVPIFSVYTSTGKVIRVLASRQMTDEENLFYARKSKESL